MLFTVARMLSLPPLLLLLLLLLFVRGPNRGHYITIVKSYGYWILFDDDIIEVS